MDLSGTHGVEPGVVKMLTESLVATAKHSKTFASVIGGSDLVAMLDMEQQKIALGCGDEGCLADIGGALGVPLMIAGSVGSISGVTHLHVKLLNTEEASVLKRVHLAIPCEAAMFAGTREAVRQLTADEGAPGKAADLKNSVVYGTRGASVRRWPWWAAWRWPTPMPMGFGLRATSRVSVIHRPTSSSGG